MVSYHILEEMGLLRLRSFFLWKSGSDFKMDCLNKSLTPLKRQRMQEINESDKTPRKNDSPVVENLEKKRKEEDDSLNELPNFIKKKRKSFFSSGVPQITEEDLEVTPAMRKILLKLGLCLLETPPDYLLLKGNKLKKTILLTGPRRSGKTVLIKVLAASTKASLINISAVDFIEPSASRGVEDAFEEALSQSTCILHIEDLEALSSKKNIISRRIASRIKEISAVHQDKNILVIAESSLPQNIDWELRSSFESEVFMPVLSKEERASLLKKLCQGMELNVKWNELSLRTTSYVVGDIKLLVKNAWKLAFKRVTKEFPYSSIQPLTTMFSNFLEEMKSKKVAVEMKDFLQAIQETTPTLKREGFSPIQEITWEDVEGLTYIYPDETTPTLQCDGFPTIPDTTWKDIGGLEDVKLELFEKFLKPNVILLWGPPGCGKTMLAKCVANKLGCKFWPISGTELLEMYEEGARSPLRNVFRRAASLAPCVIFLNKLETLCPSRTKAPDEGSKLTIGNTLLVEMNELTFRSGIYVIAATNRPDLLDTAVLRPGCIDTSLYVGLPDLKGRVAVFKAFTKNGTNPELSPYLDLEKVSEMCEYFSGVDCTDLVYLASRFALSENEEDSDSPPEIGIRHFVWTLEHLEIKPSVSLEERNRYLRFREKFENQRGSGKVVSVSDLVHDEEVAVEGKLLALNKEENQLME